MNNIKAKAKAAIEENEKLQKSIIGASKDNSLLEQKIEENQKLLERVNTMIKEKNVLEKKVL